VFTRLFFGMIGLGAGVALGVYAVRQVEATQRRLGPEALANAAATRAGNTRGRLSLAIDQVRAAAAAKEAELRAVYRVHSPPDAG